MDVYVIRRNDKVGWDEYDEAALVAESPEQALSMLIEIYGTDTWNGWKEYDVSIEKLSLDKPGLFIASYNAG